jgi:ATP-dependent protease ClpP protease subunit
MNRQMLIRAQAVLSTIRAYVESTIGPIKPKTNWYKIDNSTTTGGTVEVYIYDMIGDWGVSADAFARELAGIRADVVSVRLNSHGGDAWDGLAIYNALRVHPARCEVYVDGVAASAASVAAMAGERVVMRRGTRMMVHDASMMVYGNAALLQEAARILDGISDDMAGVYAAKAGGTAEQWRTRMRGEGKDDGTWYSAEESVAIGLADATDFTEGGGGEGGVVPGEDDEDPMAAWAGIIPVLGGAAPEPPRGTIQSDTEIDYAEIGSSILAAMKGAVT